MSWWVTYREPITVKGRQVSAACVDLHDQDAARAAAREFGEVLGLQRLPYPAEPRLTQADPCPSFCVRPQECAGRGSCPRAYACSE